MCNPCLNCIDLNKPISYTIYFVANTYMPRSLLCYPKTSLVLIICHYPIWTWQFNITCALLPIHGNGSIQNYTVSLININLYHYTLFDLHEWTLTVALIDSSLVSFTSQTALVQYRCNFLVIVMFCLVPWEIYRKQSHQKRNYPREKMCHL